MLPLLSSAGDWALKGLAVLVWCDGNFEAFALDGLFCSGDFALLLPHTFPGSKLRLDIGDFSLVDDGTFADVFGEREDEKGFVKGDLELFSGVVLAFIGEDLIFGGEILGVVSFLSCSLRCFFSLSPRRNLGSGRFGFLSSPDEKLISHARPS